MYFDNKWLAPEGMAYRVGVSWNGAPTMQMVTDKGKKVSRKITLSGAWHNVPDVLWYQEGIVQIEMERMDLK